MNTNVTKLTSLIAHFGLPAVALLLLAGHFAPWAAHKTAVLTSSAHDLAISTHFTPGAGIFLNQWFYLPVWAAALLFAFLAGAIGWWPNRAWAALGCVGLASLGLPGYPQVLTAWRTPDYQLQFFVSLIVMVLSVALAMMRAGQPPIVRAWAAGTLPLLGIIPLVGYLMIKPALEALYHDTLGLGLGWWLTLLGALLALAMLAGLLFQVYKSDLFNKSDL